MSALPQRQSRADYSVPQSQVEENRARQRHAGVMRKVARQVQRDVDALISANAAQERRIQELETELSYYRKDNAPLLQRQASDDSHWYTDIAVSSQDELQTDGLADSD